MKTNKSKLIMVTGALLLLTLFLFPMWQITLSAPQYPDPIGMNIHVNKITDMNPNDLQNINLMNHYIGMEKIPEIIPEFSYFSYIVFFMVVIGLVFGLIGNRKLYLSWFIMMALLGTAGMYDFWLWEYNYGHNLSAHAAIKFVDDAGNPLAYQPPLLGSKTILNFVATSYPSVGAYLLFLGMLLSVVAYYVDWRRTKNTITNQENNYKTKQFIKHAAAILVVFSLASCTIESKEIQYGTDDCHYCRMHIVDKQHAAEVVTNKGKVYVYDAIECMLNELSEEGTKNIALTLTNIYGSPSKLYDTKSAFFLINSSIPSPMGANLSAFRTRQEAEKVNAEKGKGKIYTWEEIKYKFEVLN